MSANRGGPTMKVGFIGAGKMAQAFIGGLLASGTFSANEIIASTIVSDVENLHILQEMNVRTTLSNEEVFSKCDYIIVAVKPPVVSKVIEEVMQNELCFMPQQSKLLVSIAAGIRLSNIEKWCGNAFRMARVMPNTPVLVRSGVAAFCLGSTCRDDDAEWLKTVLSSIGYAVQIPESLFDSFTGISGCGPAFVYTVIESMAEGGVKMGLPRQLAIQLAALTVQGSAKMVLETQKHPAVLREEVESPGGSTIYGVHELEKHGIRNAFITAVESASIRTGMLDETPKRAE